MLSGHSSGTPIWSENLEYFTKNHIVFSIDILWDVWKSVQNTPLENGDDSLWIAQTVKKLWISKAHFVGRSFWAGYLVNFAIKNPEKVESVTLLKSAIALNALIWVWQSEDENFQKSDVIIWVKNLYEYTEESKSLWVEVWEIMDYWFVFYATILDPDWNKITFAEEKK